MLKKSKFLKKIWNFITNNLGKNNNSKNTDIKFIKYNNIDIDYKIQIATKFISYYNKVGVNLAKKIPDSIFDPSTITRNLHSLFIKATNPSEISHIIKNMGDKCGCVDKINMKMIKTLFPFIAKPLAFIFNTCIASGIWPTDLKKADIIPVYKSDHKSNMSNYRPISLISNLLAKIFEKVIFTRLYTFFHKNKIISEFQFRFLSGIGTKQALHKVSDLIYKGKIIQFNAY